MSKRVELNESILENVTGGSIVFNPQGDGNYYMECEYSGDTYYDIALGDIMKVIKYAAKVPNTPEGEQDILNFCRNEGII